MKVISFNSYKGGACRTTTCYNTLPFLAKKFGATTDQPIIVFDVDLDSMGLTSLLKTLDYGSPLPYSARHLFIDDEEGINRAIRSGSLAKINYYSFFDKVGTTLGLDDDGSVLFCGADINADTISDEQFKTFENNSPLVNLISAFYTLEESKRPKAIIFDCASGIQQTTLNVLSEIDCAVMCMRPTTQFRLGTADYLINKIPKKLMRLGMNKNRRIILLPTSVSSINICDSDPNFEKARQELLAMKEEAFEKIEDEIAYYIKQQCSRVSNPYGYELDLSFLNTAEEIYGLPEIERFKWSEAELLYKIAKRDEALTEQEKLLIAGYEKLADVIAR